MDFNLTDDDWCVFARILNGQVRIPDLTIAPDGKPYLFRWHLIPRNRNANVYLHIQVADDPREELHDHPWDNQSVILAGGYTETINKMPKHAALFEDTFERKKGDVIFRRAAWAHKLKMGDHPYTMTLFSTGPHIRDWGYWFPDGWHHNRRHNVTVNGKAIFREEM